MKVSGYNVAAASARLYTPILILFAAMLLAKGAPGGGVGFSAGLTFALALALHALVFGGQASRMAFPPFIARGLLALGALAAFVGAGLSNLALASQLIEAGLFVTTASAAALILTVLIGRAPILRDAE